MTTQLVATSSLGEEVKLFVQHVDSLYDTLPLTMVVLQGGHEIHRKALKRFLEEKCEPITTPADEETSSGRFQIPFDCYSQWQKLHYRANQLRLANLLIPRSILVSLVSQYDAFLGRLLKSIYRVKPELVNKFERSLTFTEITNFESIEAIREHVIEKVVENILRSSHKEQIKTLESTFDLSLTKGLDIWPAFIELTERRNLFVHTDGIVSHQYLMVCKQNNVKLDGVSEGQRLEVSKSYFTESCHCILELGVKLAQVLWRKVLKSEVEAADSSLIEVTYELIEREEYKPAIALLDFACETLKNHSSEAKKLTLTINRAQAYKWQGEVAKTEEILNKIDWSAKSDSFKLGNAVLRSDWKKAATIMEKVGRSGEISKPYFRDWPLFKEFRKQVEFLSCYREVFGEEFAVAIKEGDASQISQDIETASFLTSA